MLLALTIFFVLALIAMPVSSSGDSDVKKDHTQGNAMQDRATSPRVDNLTTHLTPQYATTYVDDAHSPTPGISLVNRPVIDSLLPTYHPSQVRTPSDRQKTVNFAIAIAVVVGLCAMMVIIFFLVRYYIRRAAIRRRRQASWILRSGHWSPEGKQANAHGTRTGHSDTSSLSAYPYPLSEHF